MEEKRLNDIITTLESKWLDILFRECSRQFSAVHLPSHDQWHHLRVWQHAKKLIVAALSNDILLSESDIEQTMIGVFFHDQGMCETMAKEHGAVSRRMCSDFFITHPSPHYKPGEILLQAIGQHDQKDYASTSPLNTFELQKFLNIADDMDAFGNTGVYRYLEIYLLRQIPLVSLPEMILTNLESRYRYLYQSFAGLELFITKQSFRYEKSRLFFTELQHQIMNLADLEMERQGPLGVVNIIRNDIIGKRKQPDMVNLIIQPDIRGSYTDTFFQLLREEYRN